jgi:hypothetical protein
MAVERYEERIIGRLTKDTLYTKTSYPSKKHYFFNVGENGGWGLNKVSVDKLKNGGLVCVRNGDSGVAYYLSKDGVLKHSQFQKNWGDGIQYFVAIEHFRRIFPKPKTIAELVKLIKGEAKLKP